MKCNIGVYSLALPVGAALGYGIGAAVGPAISWNAAFFVCGVPGFIAALAVLKINNPARGVNDRDDVVDKSHPRDFKSYSVGILCNESSDADAKNDSPGTDNVISSSSSADYDYNHFRKFKSSLYQAIVSFRSDASEVLSNPHFLCALVGYIATNFSLGGLADWFASYMVRYTNSTITAAGNFL